MKVKGGKQRGRNWTQALDSALLGKILETFHLPRVVSVSFYLLPILIGSKTFKLEPSCHMQVIEWEVKVTSRKRETVG